MILYQHGNICGAVDGRCYGVSPRKILFAEQYLSTTEDALKAECDPIREDDGKVKNREPVHKLNKLMLANKAVWYIPTRMHASSLTSCDLKGECREESVAMGRIAS